MTRTFKKIDFINPFKGRVQVWQSFVYKLFPFEAVAQICTFKLIKGTDGTSNGRKFLQGAVKIIYINKNLSPKRMFRCVYKILL